MVFESCISFFASLCFLHSCGKYADNAVGSILSFLPTSEEGSWCICLVAMVFDISFFASCVSTLFIEFAIGRFVCYEELLSIVILVVCHDYGHWAFDRMLLCHVSQVDCW